MALLEFGVLPVLALACAVWWLLSWRRHARSWLVQAIALSLFAVVDAWLILTAFERPIGPNEALFVVMLCVNLVAAFVLVQALTGFTSIGRFGGRTFLGQSATRQFDNLGDSGYDGYRGD